MDRRTALSAHALSQLGIDTSQTNHSRPLKRKFGTVANRKEQRKHERMAAKQQKHALYQKKHAKPSAPAPALPVPSPSAATKAAKALTRSASAPAAPAESAKQQPHRRDLPDATGGAAARFHSMFDGAPVSEADADRKMVR